MPTIQASDVSLYYEEAGSGVPILFIHEMAGDWRSWEPQMRHFSRSHRCITYSARGYHPSSVPDQVEAYSQKHAAADALAVLDGLGIEKAHIVGLSMGSYATVQFGLDYPERALSLTIVGCGSGTELATYAHSQARYHAMGDAILQGGFAEFVESYSTGPYRQPFLRKDVRGWTEFQQRLAEHSAQGTAFTLKGVQGQRPSLYTLKEELSQIPVPALVVTGDVDTPCIAPSVYLSQTIPDAGLWVLPRTGHTVNLEEPELFNRVVGEFLADSERKALKPL